MADEVRVDGFSIGRCLWKGFVSFALTAGAVALPPLLEWAANPEAVAKALEGTELCPKTLALVAGLITALIRMWVNARKNV